MKCPNCGAQTNGGKFCQYCGAAQEQPTTARNDEPPKVVVVQVPPQTVYVQAPPQTPPQAPPQAPQVPISGHKRWVAFFLCLIFGWFGVHKFYVGKVGMGLLYFFTLGLFTIGWFVDLIVIASGSSTDKWGRRLV